jgi:adenylate cyclase
MTNEIKQVLVVDDDELARIEIAHSIEKQGHSVRQSKNGEQALQMLQAGGFDIVLLDLLMPGIDGYEVLQKMKADSALSSTPVSVITASGDSDSAAKSKSLAAADYFTKPVDHQVLADRVDAILADGN